MNQQHYLNQDTKNDLEEIQCSRVKENVSVLGKQQIRILEKPSVKISII